MAPWLRVGACVAGLAILAGFPSLSFGQGSTFSGTDKSPAKNPCPDKGKVPDSDYEAFKALLKRVLDKESGVIEDIDAQVKGRVPDEDERIVVTEFYVVDLDEFKKEYSGDVDSLYPDKKQADLEAQAGQLYNDKTAYTYITEPDADGKQKVKVKVFCKDSFRTGMIDGSMLETIIHELVHAKLYTMRILMPDKDPDDPKWFPFPDHDGDGGNDDKPWKDRGDKEFYDEVKRLLEKAKKNLKIAYLPGTRFTSELLASVGVSGGGLPAPVMIHLRGRGAFVMGPAGDANRDGKTEVPIEIVQLELTGTTPIPVRLRDDPAWRSTGIVQESVGGAPFPADSFFDVYYEIEVPGGAGHGLSRISASPSRWPPFGVAFLGAPGMPPGDGQPPDGQPPNGQHLEAAQESATLTLLSLTFVAGDSDGDGMADMDDPDDDNDGTPDAEDPLPRPLPFRSVVPALASDR